jgi:rRNA maturation RNase YbeY
MTVVFANRQRTEKINLRLLKRIVKALLVDLEIAKAELEINLVTASETTRLNEKFLQHKGSTDVIAFDYRDSVLPASCRQIKSEFPAGCRKHVHGEIFICMDEAVLQARKFGTSWQSEVVRYIVHGFLHLLGHDDLCAGAQRKMKREENRLLRKLSRRFALSKL